MRNILIVISLAFALLGLVLCFQNAREVVSTEVYAGPAQPAAPTVGINSIGRGRLSNGGFGGTCFLLKNGGQTYLMGAYHVLGSSTGATLVSRIPKLAVAASALKVGSQGESSYGREPAEDDARGDLAGFRVSESDPQAQPLSLASSPPQLQEPVWIVELVGPDETPLGSQLRRGLVHRLTNHTLVVKMDQGSPVRWTSGAPVVNQRGEVVGLNVGEHSGNGMYCRIAVPWHSLRELVVRN